MSNVNTVAGITVSGSGRNQWPTQSVSTTAETILQIGTDSGTNTNFFLVVPTGVTAATSSASLSGALGATTGLDINANPAITELSAREYGLPSGNTTDQFSSSSWDGRPFRVRVCGIGHANAHAGNTLLFNLYQGTSSTLGSDNLLGTSGGSALDVHLGGAFNWLVEATLMWDATLKTLSGEYHANVGYGGSSVFTTTTAITTPVTSVTAAKLSFLATVTFGDATAPSTVTVRSFVVDKI